MEQFQSVPAVPAPALRPFVERYVGFKFSGLAPGVHRGLPTRHLGFYVSIGEPLDVIAQSSACQPPQQYRCVVSGLQPSSVLVAHNGGLEGVSIELTPLGSRALLGVPASALWDLSLELTEVVGARGAELWARLQETRDWPLRFATCDAALLSLAGGHEVAADLRHCWTALATSHGQLPVATLAERLGYSRQHLRRRFRDEFGLTPKLAARLVRFDRARLMLRSATAVTLLADVAVACGYYDQAHLAREFAALGGCTPGSLVRDDLPNVQDTTP